MFSFVFSLSVNEENFDFLVKTEKMGCISPSLPSVIHVSPNMELKQIQTLTEMDACTCTVPLYMYVHVHVYQNYVDERID